MIDPELRAYLDGMRDDLRTEIRASAAELRAELRSEFRADLGSMAETLQAEIRAGDEETRRHTGVLFEALRSDIRLVAEIVAGNTEAIARVRTDLTREMDERFHVVHLAFADVRRELAEIRAGR